MCLSLDCYDDDDDDDDEEEQISMLSPMLLPATRELIRR
jgi:hypothetical protein